jgi:hypothetical protein
MGSPWLWRSGLAFHGNGEEEEEEEEEASLITHTMLNNIQISLACH